jgi:hypothetical protein
VVAVLPSRFLGGLNQTQRLDLEKRLWEAQNHHCYICEDEIDLVLHADSIEIDHIEPLSSGGKDDPTNFGLVHQSCNRSKQASDLRVARVLSRFEKIREKNSVSPNRPNLSDVLGYFGGAKYELSISLNDDTVDYSLPETGDNKIGTCPVYLDELSQMKYFFIKLPIEYLFHDDRINPRAIGGNLHKLVEEFYRRRPQLHISLGWVFLEPKKTKSKVSVFDGQHKAAAQVLLGVHSLPVRVFLNPNLDLLLTTNTNAGTTLRQVAFDKSVQRHLGSTLYTERLRTYQKAMGKSEDDYNFSEKDLVSYFKGEHREIKRYILDDVRNSITHNPENTLKDFIDFGGREQEKPLSYSTIEKTFYSFFIYQDVLETPLDYRIDSGDNPRQLEKSQITRLMRIIAQEIYDGKFDPDIGTYQIEKQVQKGEDIPEDHLRAFRMSKEEILYNWLDVVAKTVKRSFLYQGRMFDEAKLFEYKFPEPLWDTITRVIRNLTRLAIWKNLELSNTVFGGKQNYEYWRTIFETGKTPQGADVMPAGLNLDELLKE